MQVTALINYLDKLLSPELFADYCPNGLQVAGCLEVKKVVTGVTACQALLDVAVAKQADLVLVHHGYFWKGENPCVVGMKHKRLKTLLTNDINLIAYHLPLDAHQQLGNNVQLAEQLGLIIEGELVCPSGPNILLRGRLPSSMSAADFAELVSQRLSREVLHIPAETKTIETIAWCTGGAPDFIEMAIAAGVDAYLTGEVAERTTHSAREMGIHFYSAGHHATERYGIKALGEHLAEQFDLQVEFVDIDNPV